MLSHAIDAVLLLALVLTSIRTGVMYRELKRLRALQQQYQPAFDQTTAALASIRAAVREINRDGRETLEALGALTGEARLLVAEIEARLAEADAAPAQPRARRTAQATLDRAAA